MVNHQIKNIIMNYMYVLTTTVQKSVSLGQQGSLKQQFVQIQKGWPIKFPVPMNYSSCALCVYLMVSGQLDGLLSTVRLEIQNIQPNLLHRKVNKKKYPKVL